jgi:hypothetical protein
MPKRQKLLDEINAKNGLGIFLMAQMDATPDTLQFIIATGEIDEAAGGLRDKSRYIIRALGVQEHRLSVGMFQRVQFTDEHPLLSQYNEKPVGVFFRGTPADKHELVLDIFQTYASTFGHWRQIPDYLNLTKPLTDLVSGGGDLLGEMPESLATRMEKTLQHHQLETKLTIGERPKEQPKMKVLTLDDSFTVAMDFSVDELGKV